MTCWRRVQEWQARGLWPDLQALLSEAVPDTAQADWSRLARTAPGAVRRRVPRQNASARHALRLLALAEEAGPHLRGPGQAQWLTRLEDSQAEIEAAFTTLTAQGEVASALRLGAALFPYWWVKGQHTEGARRLQAALQACPDAPRDVRARALYGLASFAQGRGEYESATELHEQALALWRLVGHRAEEALVLGNLGFVAMRRGEYRRANVYLTQELVLAREVGDRWVEAAALNTLGNVATREGRQDEAGEYLRESLRLRRDLGDRIGMARSLTNLGLVALRQGEPERAAQRLLEALHLRRDLGDTGGTSQTLHALGLVALERGERERAAALLGESITLAARVQDPGQLADGVEALASLATQRGSPGGAVTLFRHAERLREHSGTPRAPADEGRVRRIQELLRSSRTPLLPGLLHPPREGLPDFEVVLEDVCALLEQWSRPARSPLGSKDGVYRRLFEQVPVSLQLFSPDGYTLDANAAWSAFWGVRPEEIADRNVLEDAQFAELGVTDLVRRAFEGEAVLLPPLPYDKARLVGQGRRHYLQMLLTPLKDSRGRVREVLFLHGQASVRTPADLVHLSLDLGLTAQLPSDPAGLLGLRRFPSLSPREAAVVHLIAEGHSDADIAATLGVTEHTVKFHVKSVLNKLGAVNRAHAVAIALKHRLL
ncbi:hypothetical protein DAETH_38010 (plasmid) [Deinococcus aetherius]|uniref:HTH luxR-type domain-containing protein n=2 Tax=Deinococcus aetherius TaxID=200252 RepID=A0ABN6RKG0_9DEIO|nr:hypothetical protein DAETH_38010 [Deinococcus aetherius]